MTDYIVGNRYPQFATGLDYTSVTIGEDNILTLLTSMCRPTATEVADYNSGNPFELRAGIVDNTIVILSKVGGQPWCDSFYAPMLNHDRYLMTGNALHILLFDSSTGELKQSRIIGLSPEFVDGFRALCNAMSIDSITIQLFQKSRDRLQKAYTTDQLLPAATIFFKLDERAESVVIAPIPNA